MSSCCTLQRVLYRLELTVLPILSVLIEYRFLLPLTNNCFRLNFNVPKINWCIVMYTNFGSMAMVVLSKILLFVISRLLT